mgnify:CR=1 FL=1
MARKSSSNPTLPEGYGYVRLAGLVRAALHAKLSVLVRGHPGVGKSTLARQLADELGLPLIDIRLAQRDPVDLAGVYFPDRDTQTLVAYPPDWARQAEAAPAFVFLDEINAAVTRLHQAAAYQIVLERRVGNVHFHPDTVVMAAGNLEEDNAVVTSLSSALCNRFVHFVHDISVPDWIDWAAGNGVHPDVIAYIGAHGLEALYDNNGDVAFPTPRSWAMAGQLLNRADEDDRKHLVAACVGRPAAEKLQSYMTIYRKIDAEKIVRKGLAMDFSAAGKSEASFIYAAVFAVGTWIYKEPKLEDAALPNIVKFLRSPGLDAEYAFLFLRYLRSHDRGVWARLRPIPSFRVLAAELVGLRRANFA